MINEETKSQLISEDYIIETSNSSIFNVKSKEDNIRLFYSLQALKEPSRVKSLEFLTCFSNKSLSIIGLKRLESSVFGDVNNFVFLNNQDESIINDIDSASKHKNTKNLVILIKKNKLHRSFYFSKQDESKMEIEGEEKKLSNEIFFIENKISSRQYVSVSSVQYPFCEKCIGSVDTYSSIVDCKEDLIIIDSKNIMIDNQIQVILLLDKSSDYMNQIKITVNFKELIFLSISEEGK